jgi:hypothetical protein
MISRMTRREALAYVRRHESAGVVALRELRRMSALDRLRLIAAAMRLGALLGLRPAGHPHASREVRDRWLALRRRMS